MRVLIFCPDRHLTYDGTTPERAGVGGGVTARIRLAEALASAGHEVVLQGSCPDSRHKGVQYLRLGSSPPARVDVLLVHSSGGALDVTEAASLPVEARLRFLFISGVAQPRGAELIHWDALYAPSNFIAGVIRSEWPIGHLPVWVVHHGVVRRRRWFPPKRNPFRLIYTSHPSKGLDGALALVRLLREEDRRFELVVCGGNGLWGQKDEGVASGDGVTYLGLLGQDRLWDEYLKSSFAMHLQARPEPFGLSLIEAMAAGCIVVASPVGSFPELVRHGETGLLVEGNPESAGAIQSASALMKHTLTAGAGRLRKNAEVSPCDWKSIAVLLEGQWIALLQGTR